MTSANANLKIVIDAQNLASKEFKRLTGDMKGMSNRFSTELGLIKSATKWAAAGVVAFTAAIGAAGYMALKTAGQFEQNRMAFETMLGSADKAKELMNEIVESAKKTPFELDELVGSTKQLLAMGIEQENVIKTTEMLGDISAGLGVELSRVAYNYGQVKTQTKLTGVEMKDFMRAGIPMLEALANVMDKSENEIKEMVSAGKVGFEDVEKAFQGMTGEGGKFYNLMEKQSKTLDGVISNLKDSFTILGMEIVGVSATGDIIAGGLFEKIKNAAVSLFEWIEKNQDMLKQFASGAVQDAISKITEWYNSMGGADGIIAALQKTWAIITNDVMPVLTSLLKIVGEVIGFMWKYKEVIIAVVIAWEAMKIVLAVIEMYKMVKAAIIATKVAMVALNGTMITVIATWGALIAVTAFAVIMVKKAVDAYVNLEETLNDVRKANEEAKAATERYKASLDTVKQEKNRKAMEDAIKVTEDLQKEVDELADRYEGFGGVVNAVLDQYIDNLKVSYNWAKKAIDKFKDYRDEKKGRAVGGSVTGGQPYMVGERGPEMFVPATNGRIEKNPQSGGEVNINFNNPVVRSDADLDSIISAVKKTLNNDARLAQHGVSIA